VAAVAAALTRGVTAVGVAAAAAAAAAVVVTGDVTFPLDTASLEGHQFISAV
jgi:hypothetical protein